MFSNHGKGGHILHRYHTYERNIWGKTTIGGPKKIWYIRSNFLPCDGWSRDVHVFTISQSKTTQQTEKQQQQQQQQPICRYLPLYKTQSTGPRKQLATRKLYYYEEKKKNIHNNNIQEWSLLNFCKSSIESKSRSS